MEFTRVETETGLELHFVDDDTTKRKVVINCRDNTVIIYDWIDDDLQVTSIPIKEFMSAACEIASKDYSLKLA